MQYFIFTDSTTFSCHDSQLSTRTLFYGYKHKYGNYVNVTITKRVFYCCVVPFQTLYHELRQISKTYVRIFPVFVLNIV